MNAQSGAVSVLRRVVPNIAAHPEKPPHHRLLTFRHLTVAAAAPVAPPHEVGGKQEKRVDVLTRRTLFHRRALCHWKTASPAGLRERLLPVS